MERKENLQYESRMRTLYRQDGFPVLQNRTYSDRDDAVSCIKGDIHLVEDLLTGLVYNAAFDPGLLSYDRHYNNEQGFSSEFKSHLHQVARIVENYLGRKSLVEIGCGKGTFLEMLLGNGIDVKGFDPAYEGDSLHVAKELFSEKTPVKGKGLILRHVLEHIEDPFSFLQKISIANGGDARVYIEVPCFDWICQHKTWFDVFYEHVNYFRLQDLQNLFGDVLKCGRIFGGQYLYVVANLSTLRQPKYSATTAIEFPADFNSPLEMSVDDSCEQKIIWGASSKGVIYSLLIERFGRPVDFAIDINPAKQGRYLPGTGVRVHSPEDAISFIRPGQIIYVMNSNYIPEISAATSGNYILKGIDSVA